MSRLLLCCDLDRTLIPNGKEAESNGARELFSRFIESQQVTLAYVSGRHRELIMHAIEAYRLPQPDFAIADVGSTIYRVINGAWQQWPAWDEEIDGDWQGADSMKLHKMLLNVVSLKLQEQEKQGRHKLSYYLPLTCDHRVIISDIEAYLAEQKVRANLIWSVDELKQVGLLDILPASANKLHAIAFLRQCEGYDLAHTLFAGDSGNDLDVFLSPVHSIVVANADEAVLKSVTGAAADNLYLARGGFLGMNGCYSAGVLEGIAHYRPEFAPVLEGLL